MHWVLSIIALVCALAVLLLALVGLFSTLRKSFRFVTRTAVSLTRQINSPVAAPPPRARHSNTVPAPRTDGESGPTA